MQFIHGDGFVQKKLIKRSKKCQRNSASCTRSGWTRRLLVDYFMLFKQKQLGMKFRAEVKLLTDPIGQMSVPDALFFNLFITEYATHKIRAGKNLLYELFN